jgi:hypothetical protein
MGTLLPEIAGRIMAGGPILIDWRREQEEEARKREEEHARRQELRRLKQMDEDRWRQFCAFATDWQERNRLLAFLAEVQRRSEADADVTIADKKMSEWIAWARQKIDSLDVFESGIAGLFERVSAPIPPTHGHWMDS